jgi:predicted secreted protein
MADHLTASRNEEFKIELESYPSSGAMWQYVKSVGNPECVHEELRPIDDSIGSPATQVFTFRVDQAGRHNLTFELKRPWEPAARSRRAITVDIQ